MLYSPEKSEFFHGRVFGETNSHVNAHIEDGLLTASIVTKEDSFHIEVTFSFIKWF